MKTLVFLLDAVSPRHITKKTTPFLYELKKKQYADLISLLGFSNGIHPSIWTGTYQEKHGKFTIFYYDPKNSPFTWARWLKIIPTHTLRKFFIAGLKYPYYIFPHHRHLLPKILSERIIPLPPAVPIDVAPYFSQAPRKPVGTDLFAILRKNKITYTRQTDYDNAYFDETKKLEEFKLTNKDCDFFYVYWPDGHGHWHGPFSETTKEYLARADKKIKELYTKAKKQGEVSLFIFSDHGMCEVKDYLDVQKHLKKMPLKHGEDYIAFFDATMGRFWPQSKKARTILIETLQSIQGLTYLDEKLLEKYHLRFPNPQTYGPLMALVKPETRIFPDYFAPLKGAIKGLHGFDPYFRDSRGIFMSNCLSSQKKEISVVDILPTISRHLNLEVPADVLKNLDGKIL